MHHTIGAGANQSAAGNHNHAATYAPIANGVTNGDTHEQEAKLQERARERGERMKQRGERVRQRREGRGA